MIRCSQFWSVHRICPGNLGVYGCCLKNFVVWLRPEQLERSAQMEDNLDVRGAPLLSRAGVSGLRPQSRPTVLGFCGRLTGGHTKRGEAAHTLPAGFCGSVVLAAELALLPESLTRLLSRAWPGLGSPGGIRGKDGVPSPLLAEFSLLNALGFMRFASSEPADNGDWLTSRRPVSHEDRVLTSCHLYHILQLKASHRTHLRPRGGNYTKVWTTVWGNRGDRLEVCLWHALNQHLHLNCIPQMITF